MVTETGCMQEGQKYVQGGLETNRFDDRGWRNCSCVGEGQIVRREDVVRNFLENASTENRPQTHTFTGTTFQRMQFI